MDVVWFWYKISDQWHISRVVKMGWNPWVNPAHHRFGSGWVEIFLQISIRVDFWPGSPRL